MEIAPEHKTQIEEIISGMECQKDFKCYKSGFEDMCKVRDFRDENLIECLGEDAESCKLSFHFGIASICKCPLRRYIAKNFNR